MNKRDLLPENSSCVQLPKFKSGTALWAKLNFCQLECPGSSSLLRSSRDSVRKILLTRTGIQLVFPASSAQTMTNTKAQHCWKLTAFRSISNPTSIKCHVLFTSTCLGEGKNLPTGKHASILLLKVALLSRSFILVMRNWHTQESRQTKLVDQVYEDTFAFLRRHSYLTNEGTVTSLNRSIA